MSATGAGELLQILRDGRPRTRSELVEETGLARTSVVNRLGALTAIGLVVPTGTVAASGGQAATHSRSTPGRGVEKTFWVRELASPAAVEALIRSAPTRPAIHGLGGMGFDIPGIVSSRLPAARCVDNDVNAFSLWVNMRLSGLK
ncbi:hypothetical protein FQR65_LT20621 [Abscondita terminalis]|nr:hypothetical protein FQR65_LT20621 [Abscondita terminalis]